MDLLATTSTTGSSGSSGALSSKTNPPATRAETWSRFSWIGASTWPRGEPWACTRLPPVDTARLFRSRSRRPPGATSMRSPPERSRLSFRRTMAAGGLRPASPPSAWSPLARSTTAAEFVPSPSIVTVQLDRLKLAPAQTPNAAHRPSRGAFDRGRTMSIPSSSSAPDRSSSQTDGAVGSLGSAGVGWKRIRGRVGPGTARMLHGPLPPSGVLERTQSASAATSRLSVVRGRPTEGVPEFLGGTYRRRAVSSRRLIHGSRVRGGRRHVWIRRRLCTGLGERLGLGLGLGSVSASVSTLGASSDRRGE